SASTPSRQIARWRAVAWPPSPAASSQHGRKRRRAKSPARGDARSCGHLSLAIRYDDLPPKVRSAVYDFAKLRVKNAALLIEGEQDKARASLAGIVLRI